MKILLTGMATIAFGLCNVAHAENKVSDMNIFDLPITTLSGDTFTLKDYQDRQAVYLKFWATWCQPCRNEMPHLQHTFEQYGDTIKIVALNIGMNENLKSIEATRQEFELTLPIAIDSSGQLSKAFNMIGTPYHVLIDKAGRIVHKGHKASKQLDARIAQLSDQQAEGLQSIPLQHTAARSLRLDDRSDKLSALFFLSTWCDWYLKDSRPEMSENCTNAQKAVNALHSDKPQLNWRGIVSRLWTGDTDLDAYKEKYHVKHPLMIDASGDTFLEYRIKFLPTLILTKNGKEVFRQTDFSDPASLTDTVTQFIANNVNGEQKMTK